MKSSRILCLAGIAAVVVACGGVGGGKHSTTPASPRLVQACDAFATKAHECHPHRDIADTKRECETRDVFRFFERVQPADVSDKLFACFAANICAKNPEQAIRACEAEAVASIPLSPRAKALCEKLEHDLSGCTEAGGSAFGTPCDVEMRLVADDDLKLFDDCKGRNCRGGVSCINEAHATIYSRPR